MTRSPSRSASAEVTPRVQAVVVVTTRRLTEAGAGRGAAGWPSKVGRMTTVALHGWPGRALYRRRSVSVPSSAAAASTVISTAALPVMA
ncbi:hypothetical protein BH23ACT8_BH23ACT8_04270 [soil metagenome]